MAELIGDEVYPVTDEATGLTQIVTARVARHNYECSACGQKILAGELHGAFGYMHYCSDCTRRGKINQGGNAS